VDGVVGYGEAVGLDQLAGLRGDGVEAGLEGFAHMFSLGDGCGGVISRLGGLRPSVRRIGRLVRRPEAGR
jgi:hypothetical protein